MKLTISIKRGGLPSAGAAQGIFAFMSHNNTTEQQIRGVLSPLSKFFTVDKFHDQGFKEGSRVYVLNCRIHMDQTDLQETIIKQLRVMNANITLISLDRELPVTFLKI